MNHIGLVEVVNSEIKSFQKEIIELKKRIQELEPVYEWQWIVIEHRQVKRTECYYISKLEVYENLKDVGVKDVCFPIEETKRERKWHT